MTELHFQAEPRCNYAAIKARAEEILKCKVDSPNPEEADGVFVIFHKEYPIEYTEGKVPAQTAFLARNEPPNMDSYRDCIQQSWRCPDPDELLASCTESLLITEMMARMLPPKDRAFLFHGVLRAAVELTKPDALVFKHSQQVILPSDYLEACDQEPILRPGSINVRFFNISNSEGDMIMDTRGLEELGLHELQCHYRNLDPQQVAGILMNTGIYLFENGAVIESGQTVEGIEPGSKWKCQFEKSLIDEKRDVLDLNPGAPFAAGGR